MIQCGVSGGIAMAEIISFTQAKQQRQLQLHIAKNCNFNQPDEIDALIVEGSLKVQNHTTFLAYLHQLYERQFIPRDVFYDVFYLQPRQFTAQYQLDWWQCVQYAVTFLTILKENERDEYVTFLYR